MEAYLIIRLAPDIGPALLRIQSAPILHHIIKGGQASSPLMILVKQAYLRMEIGT